MLGHIIKYKTKNNKTRALFHHTLFGRMLYRNYRGRKYAYYVPGMLDNVKFARLMDSKIFVEHLDTLDIDLLNIFGEINIEPCERDEKLLNLLTGREFWYFRAQERGLLVRERKKRKVKNRRIKWSKKLN